MPLHETSTVHNEEFKTHQSTEQTEKLYADGYSVWRWPEFQTFIKRLGVDVESPITSLTIEVPFDGIVSIVQEFRGLDLVESE